MAHSRFTAGKLAILLVLVFFALLVLFPFFLVLINCLKSYEEITRTLLGFPTSLNFDNFPQAMERMNFWQSLGNSLLITVCSVGGLILIASMAAYQITRRKCLASRIIFVCMLASMAIPFQVLMVPSVIVCGI